MVPEFPSKGPSGRVRAFDVRTGRLIWTFHTIPQPGEFAYDTWPPEAYKLIGGANAWAGVTVDAKMGVVFALRSAPPRLR